MKRKPIKQPVTQTRQSTLPVIFWRDRFDLQRIVFEALKAANGWTNSTRITKQAFEASLERWLNERNA